MTHTLRLNLRSQVLRKDARGYNVWEVVTTPRAVRTAQTAMLLCDVWDKHSSRAAMERLAGLAPRMNHLVAAARDKGVHIIHAPSNTLGYYAGTPARQRMMDAPRVQPPPAREHADPPLPVDASDGGSDTGEVETIETHRVFPWTRQHSAIVIDQEKDRISESGEEVYSFFQEYGIKLYVIMGVHTNMCVLKRSFGIMKMARWGVDTVLVRDLTDALYNPALPPYVSHDEGTRLVVEYIEKFWCPTVSSEGLLVALGREDVT